MKAVNHSVGRRAATLAFCLAAVALSASVARAQARIEDCESIQAADAYNQCLAKFGPTSKVKSVEPAKPGDVKDSSAEARGRGPRQRRRVGRGMPPAGAGAATPFRASAPARRRAGASG